LILNFWASWCVSCRTEAHELESFWKAYRDQGVKVVGIAIQDEQEAAKKFAQYYGKTYILGLDEDGKAAIDYGVSGVPETFLIDRDGVIRHKEIGPVSAAMLKNLLPKIL
jgi:cytochrome c biogenesis protein CcmG/thiol:disulfide interchange protein DsbE